MPIHNKCFSYNKFHTSFMIKLNNINCTEYTAKQVTLLTAFQIYLKSDQYVLQITFISLIENV